MGVGGIVQRRRKALCCGLGEPFHRLLRIGGDPVATLVHRPDQCLRARHTRFGQGQGKCRRAGVISGKADRPRLQGGGIAAVFGPCRTPVSRATTAIADTRCFMRKYPPRNGTGLALRRVCQFRESNKGNLMPDRPYVIDQMISAKSIAARVEALAREITAHFHGTDKLVVVGLLRGSFVFIADLVREIELPVEVDFLEASSYGDSMHSSREVRILKDLRGEIAGRDVLVVEDIVDTGFTLHHVLHLLKAREPARLRSCALLDKPSRREAPIKADWTGFEISDEFVVGYGIDFAQRNRNLPYIGKVRFVEEAKP